MRTVARLGALVLLLLGGLWLYESGAIQWNRPGERYTSFGIDVSHHQGAIDWSQVATADVDFAFIKSSEGRDFVDTRFEENWRGAAQAGISRGAYHFFTFCSPGRAQAAHFLEVAPPTADALPPVADVEFVGNCRSWGSLDAVAEELSVFLVDVEAAWNVKPILYLTPDSFERVIGSRFPGHPIWIRDVFREPAPDAFRGWLIWQFSDNARIPGIVGRVDRNALRPGATLASLRVPPGRPRSRP